MTAFDNQFEASYDLLLDDFGETVVYKKPGNDDRTITAIVERNPGEVFAASGEVVTYRIMVKVHNNSTTGIASTELDEGLDIVSVPRRVGMPASDLIVDQLISAEGGVLILKVA